MLIIPKIIIIKSIFPMLAFLIVWDMVWKGIALYKAGTKKEVGRFICLFIFNTCGLLPIIYILIDSTQTDNIDLPKENDKIKPEIKQHKKTLKGGVKKGENVMPEKKQKETQKDSGKKGQKKSSKKTQK